MSDNINITVNETIDSIIVNSAISTDVIDFNLYATTETVNISVTPELTTVNINSISGGGLVTSVNGQIGDVLVQAGNVDDATTSIKGILKLAGDLGGTANLPTVPNKVDKVTGKGLSTNDFTNILKTKLDGIANGAEVNVNADWNATSGDAQILNKPTIPAAQINSDWNATTGLAQILNKPSISGLELQANKQNSLSTDGTGIKYPTVDAVNNGLADINTNAIDRITVKLSTAINKGQAVYVSGANGTNIIVSKASNTSEATSSKTIGLLETTGAINAIVNVVTDGLLTGLNTSTATIGDPVWLGTNGDLIYGLINKPYAPAHLVYIGVVTRVHAVNGEILIKVQNGFELREIHDVDLITTSPTNNQALIYESSTSLWKNKTVDKTFVGLANVDNTTDVNKPVSTAQATAIALKEDTANKSTLTSDSASTTKFPVWSAILAYFDAARIRTLLGISTLSGSNTGDQDLSGYVPTSRTINGKALSANVSTRIVSATDSSALTGTGVETILKSIIIPANFFATSDIMTIDGLDMIATGVLGSKNLRFYVNTSVAIPATLIAQMNNTASSVYAGNITRKWIIKGGNIEFPTPANITTPSNSVTSSSSSRVTLAFDVTVQNYLIITGLLGNNADSMFITGGRIS